MGACGVARFFEPIYDCSDCSIGKPRFFCQLAGARTAEGIAGNIDHVDSKRRIEAYLQEKQIASTILAPTFFMENLPEYYFDQLKQGVFAFPLSAGRKLDQVAVADIASMAVYAIEHPVEMVGQRIELASDSVSGDEVVATLSEILGRQVKYIQLPIEQVRQYAGNDIADMFERFEQDAYHVDIAGLRSKYPDIAWHSFARWAEKRDDIAVDYLPKII